MSTLNADNTGWFKEQFALKRLSQRKLAQHLHLAPSAERQAMWARARRYT